jgi:hypothetical protein
MEPSLGGINRSELSDPDLALEEPCWGEPVAALPAARAALSLRSLADDLWPAIVVWGAVAACALWGLASALHGASLMRKDPT